MRTGTSPRICILLATYNGVGHVREQIDSIRAQTVSDWYLLARDDGSTDGTRDVLRQAASEDDRISVLEHAETAPLGPAQNFSRLMEAGLDSDCNLFFPCDQDDVWEAGKLSRFLAEFPAAGAEEGPLLVHSDLAVVGEQLQPVHPSLIRHMALDPAPVKPLNYLLSRNYVTGCASAFNRRLLEEAMPVPVEAIMHDWWLAAVAAATGQICFIPTPLVQYRQHWANAIGARGFWHGLNPTNNWVKGWRAGNREFLATFGQVEALRRQARRRRGWPEAQVRLMRDYAGLLELPFWRRPMAARKLALRQGNGLLQLIYFLRLLTVSRD